MLKWVRQISIAMQYIHEMSIIHRDLKPANIFLTSTSDIKIGDFGCAKTVTVEQFANTVLGTKNYLAPELRKNVPYNHKVDVWGIACILLDLLLPAISDYALDIACSADEVYDTVRKAYSEQMVALVKYVVKLKPEERPSAADIATYISEKYAS